MKITHSFISASSNPDERRLHCSLLAGAVTQINAIWLKIKMTLCKLTAETSGQSGRYISASFTQDVYLSLADLGHWLQG